MAMVETRQVAGALVIAALGPAWCPNPSQVNPNAALWRPRLALTRFSTRSTRSHGAHGEQNFRRNRYANKIRSMVRLGL